MASYTSEIRRQDKELRAVFAEGFRTTVGLLQQALFKRLNKRAARKRALVMMSAMAGCVAMSRAIEKTDPALAKELLTAAREELERLAGR